MVAWLITMAPGLTEEVITVLNPRLSNHSVGAIMERLYVEKFFGLSGLLEYAKTGKTRCPWQGAIVDGVPWSEEVWCGSGDRFFWARKVEKLRVVTDKDGKERLTWSERERPDLSAFRETLGLPPLDVNRVLPHE